MRIKVPDLILSLVALGFAAQAQAQCSVADQIAPNPNSSGNTLTLTSATACNAVDPYQNFGTLNNQGTLVNEAVLVNEAGPIHGNAGALNNDGTLTNSVGARLQNNGLLTNNGTLVNKGTIQYNSMLSTRNYGTWVNEGSTFAFNFLNYGTLNNDGHFLGEGITNSGTLINNGSSMVVQRGFANSGVVVNNGTLISDFGPINTGVFYNNGRLQSAIFPMINEGMVFNAGEMFNLNGVNNSGQFSILAGSVVGNLNDYLQTGGITTVDGTLSSYPVDVNGGVLQGTGSIFAPVTTLDGGTIAPGNSTGTLTINGNLTFNSGLLLTEIAGTGAGQFDLLKITGTASFLSGTFAFSFLDGYLPLLGDHWLFLTADGGLTGWENILNTTFSGIPSYYGFNVTSANNGLTLSVVAVPEPEIYAMLGVGLGVIGWVGRRKTLRERAAA